MQSTDSLSLARTTCSLSLALSHDLLRGEDVGHEGVAPQQPQELRQVQRLRPRRQRTLHPPAATTAGPLRPASFPPATTRRVNPGPGGRRPACRGIACGADRVHRPTAAGCERAERRVGGDGGGGLEEGGRGRLVAGRGEVGAHVHAGVGICILGRQAREIRAVGGGEVCVEHLLSAAVELGYLGGALYERWLVLLVEDAQPLLE
jgi:hypothetical protein